MGLSGDPANGKAVKYLDNDRIQRYPDTEPGTRGTPPGSRAQESVAFFITLELTRCQLDCVLGSGTMGHIEGESRSDRGQREQSKRPHGAGSFIRDGLRGQDFGSNSESSSPFTPSSSRLSSRTRRPSPGAP